MILKEFGLLEEEDGENSTSQLNIPSPSTGAPSNLNFIDLPENNFMKNKFWDHILHSSDFMEAKNLLAKLISKTYQSGCRNLSQGKNAGTSQSQVRYIGCPPGSIVLTEANLDFPRFQWRQGLDPKFIFDIYADTHIPVDSPVCIDLSGFDLAQHVPPLSYSSGTPSVKVPILVLRVKDFQSVYAASHRATVSNPEVRIVCKECDCNNSDSPGVKWSNAENAARQCNHTIDAYWRANNKVQLRNVHPLEYPTCHYFQMSLPSGSAGFSDICGLNQVADKVNMKCFMLNFPQPTQIYELLQFKNGIKFYRMDMVVDVQSNNLDATKKTKGLKNVFPVEVNLVNRNELHQAKAFNQDWIRGHGGFGFHNISQYGWHVVVSASVDNTQFDNQIGLDRKEHCIIIKRHPNLDVDPNSDILSVVSNFESIELPADTQLALKDQFGMGWYEYFWGKRRFNVKGHTGHKQLPEGVVKVLQSVFSRQMSTSSGGQSAVTDMCLDKKIMSSNVDPNYIHAIKKVMEEGIRYQDYAEDPTLRKIIFDLVNDATLYPIPNQRSAATQYDQNIFQSIHEHLYMPILPDATPRNGGRLTTKILQNWKHYLTQEGAHYIAANEIKDYQDVHTRAGKSSFNRFRVNLQVTDTQLFGGIDKGIEQMMRSGKSNDGPNLSDARILDVREIRVTQNKGSLYAAQGGGGSSNNNNNNNNQGSNTMKSTGSTGYFDRTCEIYKTCNDEQVDIFNTKGVGSGAGTSTLNPGVSTNPGPWQQWNGQFAKLTVVVGVSKPREHILGRIDWIHPDGRFISELDYLSFKHRCSPSDFLYQGTNKNCIDKIIRGEKRLNPNHQMMQKSELEWQKDLWAKAANPQNQQFYWAATQDVQEQLETYSQRARCDFDAIEAGWDMEFINYVNEKPKTSIRKNPFLYMGEGSRATEDRAALLFVPVEDLCKKILGTNQRYGKIRMLIKALGTKTIIRYYDCEKIKRHIEYSNTKVLQPYQVDWRPATKRQALYYGCCDVCYIWDHFRPCAFNCPDAYATTILVVMIFSCFMAGIIYFFIYCCFAMRENRKAGVPNWWCALPCFRLEVEQYVMEREYIEDDDRELLGPR